MRAEWEEALRLAVWRFGLAPAAFWALTLVEWRALTRLHGAAAGLSAAALAGLMQAYPDEERRDG